MRGKSWNRRDFRSGEIIQANLFKSIGPFNQSLEKSVSSDHFVPFFAIIT
jgi:hypothetical protein